MNSNATRRPRSSKLLRGAGAAAVLTAAVTAGTFALDASATPAPASSRATAATTASTDKPTVVLEHGAFADGSSWNGVSERLRHDGYRVVAAANPLRGVHSDAAALRSVIDHVPGPVVLVGHSYGGSVASQAAAHNPKVKALVYVAAFLPDKGETALGLTNKFPGSTLADTLETAPFTQPGGTEGTDLYIRADAFRHQFAADVPAGKAALAAAAQRPVAQSALEEKATEAAWKEKPVWDVISTRDLNIPPAAQRFMARRAHAHTTEIAASHSVAVSHPGAVAKVVERAAHAAAE